MLDFWGETEGQVLRLWSPSLRVSWYSQPRDFGHEV